MAGKNLPYATTFFKAFYFEAAVTVNLTTMLVMTTIFISVMDKLPSTAYVKMIDVWLISGQLVPFMEVVLLTTREALREGLQTINHHGQKRVIGEEKEDTKTVVLEAAPPSMVQLVRCCPLL